MGHSIRVDRLLANPSAEGRDSVRAGASDVSIGCFTPSMKTCSAALVTSSGSPDQITISACSPDASRPICPPRPSASAGREVIIAKALPRLRPVAPGTFSEDDAIACISRSSNGLWDSSSSIIPSDSFTPAALIRPTLDWVAAICSKLAGRSLRGGSNGDPERAIDRRPATLARSDRGPV